MKIKLLILGACLGASLFSGCNDELSSIGTSIQPSDDTIAVYTDTFRIKTTTVLLDSIYAKTTAAQLGELYDPVYGNLKSDFMCQFYCPSGFKFEHTPIDGKIDSVLYRIYYIDMTGSSYNGAWAGDSLAPMRAEIFKITSPLEKNYYTDFDVNQYCDMSQPLGSKPIRLLTQTFPTHSGIVAIMRLQLISRFLLSLDRISMMRQLITRGHSPARRPSTSSSLVFMRQQPLVAVISCLSHHPAYKSIIPI